VLTIIVAYCVSMRSSVSAVRVAQQQLSNCNEGPH
jgi:hypothetical protein